MEMHCPKCISKEFYKSGNALNKQRYRCKACGCQFTQNHKHGKKRIIKLFALALYLSGLSMNRISKFFQVSATSIMNWIRKFSQEFKLPDVEKDQSIAHLP